MRTWGLFTISLLVVTLSVCPARAQADSRAGRSANLETPQACVEHFIEHARDEDFNRASQALNTRLLRDLSPSEAARQLYFVMTQELWIDWSRLPDRPDGMIDTPSLAGSNGMIGKERSSISLGEISIDGRAVPIRIERETGEEGSQSWLFSAQSVENIPALYAEHGPGWIDRHTPDWASERVMGGVAIWKIIVIALTLVIAPLTGYLTARVLRWISTKTEKIDLSMLKKFDWPISIVVAALILWLVVEFGLSLPGAIATIADPVVLVLFIAAITFLLMRVLNVVIDTLAREAIRRFHEEGSDSERRVLTQLTVARYTILLVTAFVGVGIVLLQLDMARTLGITLMSSAGVAAVIFGIAGHAVLGNLIAGLQIALTQPFKLGDTVYIEDNWGTIEQISYTFVVVNTWDHRRLVFPIKYFIDNWFENWSLNKTYLVKPIYVKLDYRAPVDTIREKFMELATNHERHDAEHGDDPEVLVTDTEGDDIILRMTAGGAEVHDAWQMSCDLREQMVAYIRELDDGAYLARTRVELERDE
ncbi:MAG: mechanosensitive ion channel family protein [Phycisphaerales bacterium]